MAKAKKSSTYTNAQSQADNRQLIEYRHSYHCFLANNLPEYLPPPSTVAPPPQPPKPVCQRPTKENVDLRELNLDPHNIKNIDLYLMLGLQDSRHECTAADIRKAYRKRVLEYHPDKLQQASSTNEAVEDAIFKCIFQAHQTLSNPETRKHYDSVDCHAFDDKIPAVDAHVAGDIDSFLSVYKGVFAANARFSKKHPVPDLGHAHSPREDVEAFYGFWSRFESWRVFDYLDEDESSHAENRADKRWLDRKNRTARQKRKNEDNARLHKLFEQAYKLDPRMIQFRADDKAAKAAKKMAGKMSALKISQDKEKTARQERERKEAEELIKVEAEKQERALASAKNAANKADKKIIKRLFRDNNYFLDDASDVALMTERSLILEKLLLRVKEYRDLRIQLEERVKRGETSELFTWMESIYEASDIPTSPISGSEQVKAASMASSEQAAPSTEAAEWSVEEMDALIKAIKLHPGGLRDRWQKISEWYNRHVQPLKFSTRTPEQLIKKSAMINANSIDSTPLPQTDYKAQQKRDPRIDQAAPTIDLEKAESLAKSQEEEELQIWSNEKQKRLEHGLKAIKSTDPDRWDKIATFVGVGKKDCMVRAKEIAKLLKAKRAQGAKTTSK